MINEELIANIRKYQSSVVKKRTSNEIYREKIEKSKARIVSLSKQIQTVVDFVTIINSISLPKRNDLKCGIEGIMTKALNLLYGDEYRSELIYDFKNNRSALDIRVIKETLIGNVSRKRNGFGGGVSDTISLPLRMMILKGSPCADILFLDEAFKHIGAKMSDGVGEFLKNIAKEMGIQIFMTTHDETIASYADNTINLRNVMGKVEVIGNG